jgi:hypothetical protein
MNKGAHQANLHEALISAKQKVEQKMQTDIPSPPIIMTCYWKIILRAECRYSGP